MQGSAQGYFDFGCGRCELHSTPSCKVNTWRAELSLLRSIALSCGLTEEKKWGVACYTFNDRNIFLIGAFKEYCVLSFFQGALLNDSKNILTKPGEQSQSVRQARFTNAKEIKNIEKDLKQFIRDAIKLSGENVKVALKKIDEYVVPEELEQKLNESPAFKKAYKALTPGRQRGYLIYFSQPKKSETRVARVEKCIPRILQGKGLQD